MLGDGDGWVRCDQGHRHWGRFGAAGLLIRDRAGPGGPDGTDGSGGSGRRGAGRDRVVLQHRAWWSHHGGTWGLPGGARDSDEPPVTAALREASEEAGLDPATVRPAGLRTDDHGGWSYVTVFAVPLAPFEPRPTGGESVTVRWVPVGDVDDLPLHPGFAAAWPALRGAAPLRLVVDGANVVGARGGDGWWRDRAGAARRLRDALTALTGAGLGADELPPGAPATALDLVFPDVVLVVEGAAVGVAADPPGPVAVVAAPGSGDDTIVEVAAAAPDRTVVVTADRELRRRVGEFGASVTGPRWLWAAVAN